MSSSRQEGVGANAFSSLLPLLSHLSLSFSLSFLLSLFFSISFLPPSPCLSFSPLSLFFLSFPLTEFLFNAHLGFRALLLKSIPVSCHALQRSVPAVSSLKTHPEGSVSPWMYLGFHHRLFLLPPVTMGPQLSQSPKLGRRCWEKRCIIVSEAFPDSAVCHLGGLDRARRVFCPLAFLTLISTLGEGKSCL